MATRNFWLKVNIDGRETQLRGGPRSKDGGFDCTFYVRHKGQSIEALTVRGVAIDGELRFYIEPRNPLELSDITGDFFEYRDSYLITER